MKKTHNLISLCYSLQTIHFGFIYRRNDHFVRLAEPLSNYVNKSGQSIFAVILCMPSVCMCIIISNICYVIAITFRIIAIWLPLLLFFIAVVHLRYLKWRNLMFSSRITTLLSLRCKRRLVFMTSSVHAEDQIDFLMQQIRKTYSLLRLNDKSITFCDRRVYHILWYFVLNFGSRIK